MKYKNIIDISVELDENTPIYPGNPKLTIERINSEKTKSLISKITIGTHTGTHLDAPSHAFPEKEGLNVYLLESFVGSCRVLDCTHEDFAVSKETLVSKKIKKGERILLKTKNSAKIEGPFFNDFIFLSPEGASYLATLEVVLVGIDYFSIKQKGSSDNRPHEKLLEKNIPIIEGINLSNAEEKEYFLTALPLKFGKLDGAPLRAALLQF